MGVNQELLHAATIDMGSNSFVTGDGKSVLKTYYKTTSPFHPPIDYKDVLAANQTALERVNTTLQKRPYTWDLHGITWHITNANPMNDFLVFDKPTPLECSWGKVTALALAQSKFIRGVNVRAATQTADSTLFQQQLGNLSSDEQMRILTLSDALSNDEILDVAYYLTALSRRLIADTRVTGILIADVNVMLRMPNEHTAQGTITDVAGNITNVRVQ